MIAKENSVEKDALVSPQGSQEKEKNGTNT